MSKDTVVAKRYARALFEIAQEQNRVAQFEEELNAFLSALRQNADFNKLIVHPGLTVSAKQELLSNVFGGQLSDTVLNTLQLLVANGREELLESLVGYYAAIAGEALGQAKAIVYTPFALSEADEKQIASTFSTLTSKQIRVESVIDKSLLGGIQIRVGDRLYDGSLSGKLKRLEKALNQSQAL
ncbi:F-type H+-transporting ATPase subunit delta [Paenibacillus sp. UNCCL117]|uniref:F0F1 ATP synthase subunit delta n=1 Tax=unclassified Paenibacillus TaxID=185978 RepID=UPI0008803DD1|nr:MULTISPECIES: F0F1 ATP synthase subunit delta [unclassified Paenibacillus]SDE33808.1 F-type H+-transporting ATPase subunit delta [Paenibacillus sp. cl123]SFW64112.1 F-type H+-transporting ATPase subunit delta [Paenibacillus sp. UNCCL117]